MGVDGSDDTARRIAHAINAYLGASAPDPRDLIRILQAIKAAGALQAEIEVM